MNSTELIRKNILQIEPYVPGKPVEEVKRELGLSEIIKLASNENSFGPSPKAIEAMKEACEKINVYPDANSFELKSAIARHYQLNPNNIILGNGSDENIKMLAQAFLNPGEEILFGTPSFSAYDFAAKLMAGKGVAVPLREYTYDLKAMVERVTGKTKLIFICNPNNPTGTTVCRRQVEEMLDKLPPEIIVVFDEAYAEYVYQEDFPPTIDYLREGRNVVILRTFSKIYGLAGIRVGYGLAKTELIEYLERVREPFNTNLVAQKGALAAIEDQEHIAYCRQMNKQGMEYLINSLEELGLKCIPSQANFILANTPVNSKMLFGELLKLGMIIRPGYVWGLDNYIRVTVGTSEENEKFIAALKIAIPKCQ